MADQHEACPECGASMPVHPGYTTWCDVCNWNLEPNKRTEEKKKLSLVERLNERLGDQSVMNLHHHVLEQRVLVHPRSFGRVTAYTMAIMVHLLTLYCLYEAVVHTWNWLAPGSVFIGLFLAWVTYLIFPRISKVPDLLPRKSYPTLYQVLDDMADAMNSPRVDGITVIRSFNAYFGRFGWSRKRIVGIGPPLFAVLRTEEKLAILAHEMAHNAHQDVTRTWVIHSAMASLANWYWILIPSDDGTESVKIPIPGYNLVRKGLAKCVYWMWHLMGFAVWKEMQRAEYFADRRAAELAGKQAVITAFEKYHYEPTFYLTWERVARFSYSKDLFEEYRNMTRYVPERERLRLERIQQAGKGRLDASHPPTNLRIAHIRERGQQEPAIWLNADTKDKLELEFIEAERSIQRGMLDDFRSWYL